MHTAHGKSSRDKMYSYLILYHAFQRDRPKTDNTHFTHDGLRRGKTWFPRVTDLVEITCIPHMSNMHSTHDRLWRENMHSTCDKHSKDTVICISHVTDFFRVNLRPKQSRLNIRQSNINDIKHFTSQCPLLNMLQCCQRLRLDTSTKQKMVNCWWYWPHHKKQNLYLNNMYKLYLSKVFLKPSYADILKIFKKELFCSEKGHFKVLWLFETKTFMSKVVKNF